MSTKKRNAEYRYWLLAGLLLLCCGAVIKHRQGSFIKLASGTRGAQHVASSSVLATAQPESCERHIVITAAGLPSQAITAAGTQPLAHTASLHKTILLPADTGLRPRVDDAPPAAAVTTPVPVAAPLAENPGLNIDLAGVSCKIASINSVPYMQVRPTPDNWKETFVTYPLAVAADKKLYTLVNANAPGVVYPAYFREKIRINDTLHDCIRIMLKGLPATYYLNIAAQPDFVVFGDYGDKNKWYLCRNSRVTQYTPKH